MAMKLYEENDIQNIANELRRYNGTDNKYRVEDMTLGIQDIAENIEDKLGTTKTTEGTNSLEYENAKAYRILNAEYQGNVEQETTSGVQLLNEIYYNNHTLYNKDGRYFAYIKLPDSFKTKFYGNMTLKGTSQSLVFAFSTISNGSSNGRMLDNGTLSANIEYDFTNAENVYLVIGNSNDVNIATDIPKIFNNYNIMVSTTKGIPYEPYTGGQPSPNPDYPQEVQTLKGWNLFDKDKLVQGTWDHGWGTMSQRVTIWSNKIKKGEKYTITNYDTTNFVFATGVSNYDGYNEQAIGTDDSGWYTSKTYIITASQDGYLLVQIRRDDNSNITPNDIPKDLIQITKGTTEKLYLPYNSIGIRRINQLFDNELRQGSWNDNTNTTRVFSKNNLYLKANKKYILKTNLDITKYKFGVLVNDKPFPITTSNFSYDSGWKTINELEFTTTQDGYFGLNIAILNDNNNLTPQDVNKYRFDLFNDERIDYIDLKGNELLSTDKLTVDSKGNVKLIKNWDKVVLDGSENWNVSVSNTSGIYRLYIKNIQNSVLKPADNNTLASFMSSHYKTKTAVDLYRRDVGIAIDSTGILFIYDSSYNTSTSAGDYKTWLSQNKPIIYYQLETPQEINLGKITLKSLEGLNNVEILATLEPTHMKETYMLDIQSKYLPKVTTEETSIDYVAQFPLDMTIEGNIKQETTTGKNLFDESIMPTNTMNGIKWEYTNKKIKISGTATDTYSHNENISITLQAGTYYFVKSGATNLRFNARFYNIDGELIANSERYNPFTISENATRIELLVEGMTSGTSYNQEMNFMVSTTNENYEPYTGGQPSPNPDYPQPISTIENSLKITLNNGELEDSENYLFSQIQANLPEGEFIGKINDTYKDTLKLEYNKTDGQYHLNLYKNIGKVVLDGSESGWYFNSQQHGFSINGQIGTPISPIMVSNNFICKNTYNTWTGKETFGINTSGTLWFETTVASSVDDFKAWLSTHNIEVYYALATPYVVDLGKQNKLIPFEGINNIEILAELEPSKIKTTYYIDAKKYIEDTTSALLELGGEN